MKRRRLGILFTIFIIVFAITIIMEAISISNPGSRLMVNISTLLMAIVSGGLFWVVYKGGQEQKEENTLKNTEERKFDKARYLEFAKEYNLTRREAEIGLLVLNGYTNLQIAEELCIAETTVKKHTSHIYEKVGVYGRKDFKLKYW